MLFNSFSYALFLPVVLAGYWLVPRGRRIWVILIASYVFYGAWDWRFLGLIWVSTFVDYVVGRRLGVTAAPRGRKQLVLVSVAVNLGILGLFKYWGFFVESAAHLLDQVGLQPNLPSLSIILPVGISFYTFQTMSYAIDVYRGLIEPEQDIRLFAAYVAFFPQLVAGPIERADRLLPQLRHLPPELDKSDIAEGLWLIVIGLFRKIVLADSVAPVVDRFFSDPKGFGFLGALLGVLAFTMQIYGDFSGYTAIARGSAHLLGVRLVENFREPYLARSITEFWRRWHMSLSQWLRDYLYIPLGGNRGSRLATSRNLMLTMLLGGLWHGAAWSFVLWGGLHGFYLLAERYTRRPVLAREGHLYGWLTFALVSITWIPFRSGDFGTAMDAIAAFTRWGNEIPGPPLSTLALVVFVVTVSFALDVHHERLRAALMSRPMVAGMAAGSTVVAMIITSGSVSTPFIYFQF